MNEEDDHTPGPWQAVEGDHGFEIEAQQTGRNRYIAKVARFDNTQINNKNPDEANARLIATAPELLDALIDLEATIQEQAPQDLLFDNADMVPSLEKAMAVINKATGRAGQ